MLTSPESKKQQQQETKMVASPRRIQPGNSELSKTERVYQNLRRRIRELELPPGSRLQKNEIADELGVSRAPVNEAIAKLSEEGLIDVFPQSGSFVAPIRPEDIRESMLIRTGLEVEAVRRITMMPDTSDLLNRLDANLAQQTQALEKNDIAWLDTLDEEFHNTLYSVLNAPKVHRLLDTCRALLDRPRFKTLWEAGRPFATLKEHQRIVDAIRTGDPEYAGQAMRLHLRMVAKSVEGDLPNLSEAG
ncbi:GntR family transcriptional regulator [Hyphococcus luteus]|uniref:GntR family transcriptional regulator n=1 Tax=Hyphococcus luteus TaxID=2058213 RepID=A0A2S7KAD2_9PROT|nr:GntR family transcriptional regulator [Marinicaulis flavus]PQA89409.1 GntR family transcriptional regulator [Marinicaulis flavus]